MQIIRLLQTTLILLKRKHITAKELAERFAVSSRTVYRDIDALSLAGIPVYSIKGRNGGIFLDEKFQVDDTIFEQEEQNDIFLALQLLHAIGLLDSQELLHKFESVYDWQDWIAIDLESSFGLDPNNFYRLKEAIFQEKEVSFTYYTLYGQTRFYIAIPVKFIYQNQTWYILVYHSEDQSIKPYPLTRIKKVRLLEKKKIPEAAKNDAVIFETIPVTLRFSKRIAYKKYDEFTNQAITDYSDGSYEITFNFSEMNDIYHLVLPLGGNVQIISPDWVKKKVTSHVEAFYKNQF